MRFLLLFIIISCSVQKPLKFKYHSSKRYLASLTREDVNVAKIVGELKQSKIIPTGMDSTYLFVKLYDKEGNLLLNVDPSDLTLSTNVDIEAKPFTLKQGIYKAEILPRVKSKNIRMRVDWQEKILGPEIVLDTTLAPLKDELQLNKEIHFQTVGIGFEQSFSTPTDGFSFENIGDNKIVNTKKHPNSQRSFNFEYPEQARQNIAFQVDDASTEILSDTLHSMFWLFPRKQVPVVEQLSGTIDVTLPNGEKMIFSKESKEIVGGVFTEGPVDVSSDAEKRVYPALRYQGRGVLLRINGRGQSPQLGQDDDLTHNKIDLEYGMIGSEEVLIINGKTGQRCRKPKSDFWEPIDVNPIIFKFATDEEFDTYLRSHCGFGLPKF